MFRLGIIGEVFDAEPFVFEGLNVGSFPQYNIAPRDDVLAVMERDGARRVWPLRWGLVPQWAKDISMGSRLINARSETIAEKPSFRGAVKYRRCLLPADGFYEWTGEKGAKQPYFIHRADGDLMAMAGIWETFEQGDAFLETCSIVTTTANKEMELFHDRMPVILERRDWGRWLDRSLTEVKAVEGLMVPAREGTLRMHPVSKAVSNPRAEGEWLVEPVELVSDSLFD